MTVDARLRLRGEDATGPAFSSVESRLRRLENNGRQVAGLLKGAFAAIGGAAIFGQIAQGITATTQAAIGAERSQNMLAATLRATGGTAQRTLGQLEELAQGLALETPFDDDSIRDAITTLLRFRGVSGETLERATRLSLDFASALGRDVVESARAVGRAIGGAEIGAGLRALREAGASFSDGQIELIERLDQTGQRAKAAEIVLDELSRAVGGNAGAENAGLYGASRSATKAWEDMVEAIGLLPAVKDRTQGALRVLADSLDYVREKIEALGRAQRGLLQFQEGGSRLPSLAQEGASLPGGRRMPAQEDVSRTLAQLNKNPLKRGQFTINAQTGEIRQIDPPASAKGKGKGKKSDPAREFEQREREAMQQSERAAENILYSIEWPEEQASALQDQREQDILDGIERMREAETAAHESSYRAQQAVLDQIDARNAKFEGLLAGYQSEADALAGVTEAEKFLREVQAGRANDLTEAQRLQLYLMAQQIDALREQEAAQKKAAESARRAEEFGRAFGSSLGSAAKQAILEWQGFDSLLEGLQRDLVSLITDALVIEPLARTIGGLFSGGGTGGAGAGSGGDAGGGFWGAIAGIAGSIFGAFGGARAEGGPAIAGRYYLVGERGPELVRMRASGDVIPADRTRAMLRAQGGLGAARAQGGSAARAAGPSGPAWQAGGPFARALLPMIDGARMAGGPAVAGGTYLAGEAGPEFIRMRAGYPDGQAARARGAGGAIHAPITIISPTPAAFRGAESQIQADIARAIARGARNR